MSNINDLMVSTLADLGYTGNYNDTLYNYFGSLGYTGSLDDRWHQFLVGKGYTTLYDYLGSLGHTGSLNDRIRSSLIAGDFFSSGAAVPDFSAIVSDTTTGEMLLQDTGTGTPTSTHTATIYAQDNENIYRSFSADTPVYRSGRVVENLLPYSDNFSHSSWTKQGCTVTPGVDDPLGGTGASTLKRTSSIGRLYYSISTPTTLFGVSSIWMRRRTGTGTVTMRGPDNFDVVLPVALTSEWKRYSIPGEALVNSMKIAVALNTLNDEIDIFRAQIEDSTGRADTFTPSEAIYTNGAPASKTFNTYNGNSIVVSGNLITNGTFDTDTDWTKVSDAVIANGVASLPTYLDEVNQGSFTSGKHYIAKLKPNGLGTSNIVRIYPSTSVQVSVYGDGEHQRLYQATTNGALRFQYSSTPCTIDNVEFYEYAPDFVVTEAVGDPLPQLPFISYQPAGTNLLTYSNDMANAAWTKSNCTAVKDAVGITGAPNTATTITATNTNSYALIFKNWTSGVSVTHKVWVKKNASGDTVTIRNDGATGVYAAVYLNTATGVLSNITAGVDASEVLSDGDWWVVLMEFTSSVAGSNIWVRVNESSATGSAVVGNYEVHDNKIIAQVRGLGPIFTTTAAASTDALAPAYDGANTPDAAGSLYCEWQPTIADTEASGDIEILSTTTGASLLYYDATNSQFESTDGTNTVSAGGAIVAGKTYRIGLTWDATAGSMRLSVDGTWGTADTYDGEFTGSDLDVGRASSYAAGARSIKVYADAGEATIEDLMIADGMLVLDTDETILKVDTNTYLEIW